MLRGTSSDLVNLFYDRSATPIIIKNDDDADDDNDDHNNNGKMFIQGDAFIDVTVINGSLV